jgi:hypothetical protein
LQEVILRELDVEVITAEMVEGTDYMEMTKYVYFLYEPWTNNLFQQ